MEEADPHAQNRIDFLNDYFGNDFSEMPQTLQERLHRLVIEYESYAQTFQRLEGSFQAEMATPLKDMSESKRVPLSTRDALLESKSAGDKALERLMEKADCLCAEFNLHQTFLAGSPRTALAKMRDDIDRHRQMWHDAKMTYHRIRQYSEELAKRDDASKSSLLKPRLPFFNGDLRQWLSWEQDMTSLLFSKNFDDNEVTRMTLMCLKGDAAKAMKNFRIQEGRAELMKQLKTRFAPNYLLRRFYKDRLEGITPLPLTANPAQMKKALLYLRTTVANLEASGFPIGELEVRDLIAPRLPRRITDKLTNVPKQWLPLLQGSEDLVDQIAQIETVAVASESWTND